MKLNQKIWLSDDYFFTIGWLIISLAISFLQFWMLMIANNYILEPTFLSVFMTILLSIKHGMNGTPEANRNS